MRRIICNDFLQPLGMAEVCQYPLEFAMLLIGSKIDCCQFVLGRVSCYH
jgi:hypothetical protein